MAELKRSSNLASNMALDATKKTGRRHKTKTHVFGYVCTYTQHSMHGPTGNGTGIVLVKFDLESGHLTALKTFDGPNPSWMEINFSTDRAYVVNEIGGFGGRAEGSVTSYAIDRKTGNLTVLNIVGSAGVGPTHCSVHPSGKFLLVANYESGHISVLPIQTDGALGSPVDVKAPAGAHGPSIAVNAPRGSFARSGHDASHAHMIACDPSGQFILSNDLGLDKTFVWTIDANTGKLNPVGSMTIDAASSGAGPRHFAFHPSRPYFYNLYEEASELAIYSFDSSMASVNLLQLESTLPKEFCGTNFASAVAIGKDGRSLYVGNRLHNSVAHFSVLPDGQVKLLENVWTRGDYPNHVGLDPTGRFLIASNRRSDQLTVFHIDPRTGSLKFTGQYFDVPSPNMIAFIN